MDVNRRSLIEKLAAVTATGAIAGCVGVQEADQTETQPSGDGGDGDGNTGGASTDTPGSDGDDETATAEEQGLAMLEPEHSGGVAKLWHSRKAAEKRVLENKVAQFNEQYDQQVELSEIADLGSKTQQAIPAGKGPHAFDHAHDWVGSYQRNGWLTDQRENLRLDLSEYFTPAAVEAAQFNGATVGLPYAAETVALLYNKDMVDSPPETVAEMQEVMNEHHAPSDGTYGLSYPVNSYFVSAWVHAFGGYYYDGSEDKLGLDKDETVKGMRYFMDELAPYMPDSPDYGAQAEIFKQGRAPFAINGPWFLGGAQDAGIDVGVAKLPTADGSEPSPYTGVKLLFFAQKVGKGEDKNATATREFVEWFATNPDVLSTQAEENSYIPVHRDLAGSDDLPETVRGYSQAVAQGIPMPTHPNMQDVWGPTDTAISEVYNGQKQPKEAFETAAEKVRSNW